MSMSASPVTPASSPASPASPAEKLRHFPAEVQESFARFQHSGDTAALARVIFAILGDFMPKKTGQPLTDVPPTARLIEDLGFDSLAITETVFFAEDLFAITISNEEILSVRTVGDLEQFIVKKVAAKRAA
jgi:acyl carrier protein